MTEIICAVKGFPEPNGVCGKIKVGDDNRCGAESNSCEHQLKCNPQLISNWDELAKVEESDTHRLEIEDHCGWIYCKATGEREHYLSTHTFYGSKYQYSTAALQQYGFSVEIANWDAPKTQ